MPFASRIQVSRFVASWFGLLAEWGRHFLLRVSERNRSHSKCMLNKILFFNDFFFYLFQRIAVRRKEGKTDLPDLPPDSWNVQEWIRPKAEAWNSWVSHVGGGDASTRAIFRCFLRYCQDMGFKVEQPACTMAADFTDAGLTCFAQ